jgi:hypothetical protein
VFLAARPNGAGVASFEIADAPSLVATRLSRRRWQPHLDASRATSRFAKPSSRAAAHFRWLRIVCHEEGKHFVENQKAASLRSGEVYLLAGIPSGSEETSCGERLAHKRIKLCTESADDVLIAIARIDRRRPLLALPRLWHES